MNHIGFDHQVLSYEFSRLLLICLYASDPCGRQINGIDGMGGEEFFDLCRIDQVKFIMRAQHQLQSMARGQRPQHAHYRRTDHAPVPGHKDALNSRSAHGVSIKISKDDEKSGGIMVSKGSKTILTYQRIFARRRQIGLHHFLYQFRQTGAR